MTEVILSAFLVSLHHQLFAVCAKHFPAFGFEE